MCYNGPKNHLLFTFWCRQNFAHIQCEYKLNTILRIHHVKVLIPYPSSAGVEQTKVSLIILGDLNGIFGNNEGYKNTSLFDIFSNINGANVKMNSLPTRLRSILESNFICKYRIPKDNISSKDWTKVSYSDLRGSNCLLNVPVKIIIKLTVF